MSAQSRLLLDAVHFVASGQEGLITAAQLEEIGVPRSTLKGRIRTGGPWRRILPGTYCVMPGALTQAQRDRAALLYSGATAMLTGSPALRRHGLRYFPPNQAIHTLIDHTRHRKSAGFVVVERTTRLPTPVTLDGLPVAPVARALVDAARLMTDLRATRAMALEVVQRGLATPDEIHEVLRVSQRRGTALIGDVVQEARVGVRSAPEAEVRRALLTTDLPTPLWNPGIFLPNGTFLASPDGLIEESMVAIEVDSREHHSEGEQWEDTLERGTDLANAGLQVVHVIPRKFRRNPTETLDRIRRAHERGLALPKPELTVVTADEFARIREGWNQRKFAQDA
jgi:hypothetical protein